MAILTQKYLCLIVAINYINHPWPRVAYITVPLQVTCNTDVSDNLKVLRRTIERNINLRKYDDGAVSIK